MSFETHPLLPIRSFSIQIGSQQEYNVILIQCQSESETDNLYNLFLRKDRKLLILAIFPTMMKLFT